jgi:sugar lactone lactonase YvrE
MSVRAFSLVLIVTVAVLALMGCRGDAPAVGNGPDVESSGHDGLIAWRVEEAARIGTLDGEGPTVFGRIAAIEVDEARNLLIFDRQAQELRVFSEDGHHRMSIGRVGDAPGEFRDVIGLAVGQDGSIWVVDGRSARYTIIGKDGEMRTRPRASVVTQRPWLGGFDRDGGFYEYSIDRQTEGVSQMMVRLSPEGDVTDSSIIPRIDVPSPDFGGGGVTMALPFAPQALRAWDQRGRVWQALSSQYSISSITLTGDTALVVSRMTVPIELSAAQRDSVQAVVENTERTLVGQRVPQSMYPTTIPPLRWFFADDQDNLWVCATGGDACTVLEVFDDHGTFQGSVHLPWALLDMPRPLIRDGYLYAVIEGEFDIPQVVVGRIMSP